MRISTFRGLAATALAACALLTTGAAAASAAPAVWSTTGALALTPTAPFTIKVGTTPSPADIITCSNTTVADVTSSATNTAGVGYSIGVMFSAASTTNGFCTDGTGSIVPVVNVGGALQAMQGVKTGSAYSMSGLFTQNVRILSGYVDYKTNGTQSTTYTAPWTNGTSPANPSTVTFTNAQIGITTISTGFRPIKLTGTFTVKTSAGGLITLI